MAQHDETDADTVLCERSASEPVASLFSVVVRILLVPLRNPRVQ